MLLLVFSCDEEVMVDNDALILETLKNRQKEYRSDRLKACKEDAIIDAEIYVDSILFSELKIELLDSVKMIDKPNRPSRPEYIKDVDTSEISPLFRLKN